MSVKDKNEVKSVSSPTPVVSSQYIDIDAYAPKVMATPYSSVPQMNATSSPSMRKVRT